MHVRLIKTETSNGSGRILDLSVGCEYEVLGIEANDYRLVPENFKKYGKLGPFLNDFDCFKVIESTEPPFWECDTDDGVRYCYQQQWNRPGFFEDYHDGNKAVQTQFWNDLARLYPRTWERMNLSGLLVHLLEFNVEG